MDCFYSRVERDDLLGPAFFPDGVKESHRAHVTAWWLEVLGGPARYTEELGGYEGMLAYHRGLAITPEQRFRFASLLSLAADDATCPATQTSVRRSSPMSSGKREWQCTTPSPEPRSSSTHRFHDGAGARRPRTGRNEKTRRA
jgi:Bacterial-like globin